MVLENWNVNLSQNVILYQLKQKIDSLQTSGAHSAKQYGRPVLFEEASTPDSHVVLISSASELKYIHDHCGRFEDSLPVCTAGIRPSGETKSIPCLYFNEDVPLNTALNLLQDIFMKFDSWEKCLYETSGENGDFQKLIDCCEDIIEVPLCLMDSQFKYIAQSRLSNATTAAEFMDATNKMSPDAVNDLLSNKDFNSHYKERHSIVYSFSTGSGVSCNIFYHNTYVGRVILQLDISRSAEKNYYLETLEILAGYVQLLYERKLSFEKNPVLKNRLITCILDSLDGRPVINEKWASIRLENNWSISDRFCLVQLRSNPRYDKTLYTEYLRTEIERIWSDCVVFEYHEKLFVLVNCDKFTSPEKRPFNQALAYFLRDFLLAAGISRSFTDLKYLPSASRQTEASLDYGAQYDPDFWYYRFDDYSLRFMLRHAGGSFENEMICSEKLITLREHDKQKGTEYYKTLSAYFDSRFNAVAASKALYIQRSTFLYRMKNIRKLVDIDFESKDEMLYMEMSFKILDIV